MEFVDLNWDCIQREVIPISGLSIALDAASFDAIRVLAKGFPEGGASHE